MIFGGTRSASPTSLNIVCRKTRFASSILKKHSKRRATQVSDFPTVRDLRSASLRNGDLDLPCVLLRKLNCTVEKPPQDPGRKSLPHLPALEFPNQSILQYVTTTVEKRRPILARHDVQQVLLDAWRKADHWIVGRYAIMPDHIHFFCAPARLPITPLKVWMKFWRSEATRHWPRPGEKPIWQKDFFDRQLRSGESYQQKWLYVWENPIKEGLVQAAEAWPFQGEMNVLQWHEPA